MDNFIVVYGTIFVSACLGAMFGGFMTEVFRFYFKERRNK